MFILRVYLFFYKICQPLLIITKSVKIVLRHITYINVIIVLGVKIVVIVIIVLSVLIVLIVLIVKIVLVYVENIIGLKINHQKNID